MFFLLFSNFLFFEPVVANEYCNGDLKIKDIILPLDIFLNQKTIITVEIEYNGSGNISQGEKINLFMSIEDENVSYNFSDEGLEDDESCLINLSWIPDSMGYKTINFSVVFNNTTCNHTQRTMLVKPYQLSWWNSSWHYRTFLMINGSGNATQFFNFTKIF